MADVSEQPVQKKKSSFVRKLGEFSGDLIFSFSLGFLIIFIALASFTQYNNIQPVITSTIENQLKSYPPDQINALNQNIEDQCNTQQNALVPLNNNTEISLNCNEVRNTQYSDKANLIAVTIFNQTYYKQYECNFLDCIKGLAFPQNATGVQQNQNYQVILSSTANQFFSSNQIFLIITTIVGLGLIVISVRVWYNILKIVGPTLILIGIMYLFTPLIKTELAPIAQQGQDFSAIVDLLFAPISAILRNILILGIVLTIVGYVSSFLLKPPEQKKNQPM